MHDLEGLFCKLVFSGIIDKFVQGKKCPGPKQRLARQGEGKKRGALDLASPWALGRSVKRWELQKRGEAGPVTVNASVSIDAGKQGIELVLVKRQRRCKGHVGLWRAAGWRGSGDGHLDLGRSRRRHDAVATGCYRSCIHGTGRAKEKQRRAPAATRSKTQNPRGGEDNRGR